MAITTTQILEVLNEAFAIPSSNAWTESDISVALKMCLQELSSLELLTKSSSGTQEVTNSEYSITVPAQFKTVKSLTLTDDDDILKQPLELMENGIKGYRTEMSLNNSRSYPTDYAIEQEKIYLYPPPDGTYTYLLEYYAMHLWPASGSEVTIEFIDDFLITIAAGTAYWKGRLKNSLKKYVQPWSEVYFDERHKMRGLV